MVEKTKKSTTKKPKTAQKTKAHSHVKSAQTPRRKGAAAEGEPTPKQPEQAAKNITPKAATAAAGKARQQAVNLPAFEVDDSKTTGHEWDGIKEYDNPLPRWWLWTLLATVIFSVGYVIYYPAIPTVSSFTKGIAGWSQYKKLDESLQKANAAKADYDAAVDAQTIDLIMADPALRDYAFQAGKALFALNCSQCHGAGGAGAKGYPNLLDNEWLWGGTVEAISTTIHHGIRAADDADTRNNMMMAYGDEEVLDKNQILDVVRYVQLLSGQTTASQVTERGKAIFAENCATCHGEQGEGIQEMGAPALNNAIWLYGGDHSTLVETLTHGRGGVMPAWGGKLSESDIKKLTVYVHGLGGGEGETPINTNSSTATPTPQESTPSAAEVLHQNAKPQT